MKRKMLFVPVLLIGLILPETGSAAKLRLNDTEMDSITAGNLASVTFTDGTRLIVRRYDGYFRIRGTIATPGAITLTLDGREIELSGPVVNQTETVLNSNPATIVVTERSPAG